MDEEDFFESLEELLLESDLEDFESDGPVLEDPESEDRVLEDPESEDFDSEVLELDSEGLAAGVVDDFLLLESFL